MSCKSVYKSGWDSLFYLFLYIVIPVSQVIQYAFTYSKDRFFCIILLLASLLYDCYTRFDSDMPRGGRIAIFFVGAIAIIEAIISVVLHYIVLGVTSVPDWIYYLYIPMAFPFILCIWSLIEHTRQAMDI